MAAIGEQQRRLSAANLPLHILTCAATMALRMATLKSAGEKMGCAFGLRRWTHSIAQPPPLDTPMSHTTVSSPLVLPEHDHDSINNNNNNNNVGFEFPSFCFGGGSMELMAVPKRKVISSSNFLLAFHKVQLSCGRVKLPHFYCCSGDRENTGERNEQDHNSQIGAALCLAAAIDVTPDPDAMYLKKLLPKLERLLKCDSFKAKPVLLTLIGSVIGSGATSSYQIVKNLVSCLVEFIRCDD
ncbi:TORTIFOLIA1-like protein 3 [Camellia lanceoleosa]|uniref:TORTIFOLIA1-like protein 3 n=1 Tax=Camellia lanceoleosa TaxID=1840588 RepID=A0ACC0G7N2_9ERIC|nr:TORTIFOLIA1-like protein 3 [Camellia lanceoleosa]